MKKIDDLHKRVIKKEKGKKQIENSLQSHRKSHRLRSPRNQQTGAILFLWCVPFSRVTYQSRSRGH